MKKKLSSKKEPKITVYIPNSNYNLYFEKAIISAINQDYKNFEIIIIIDGYDYEAINISKKFVKLNKNIRLFINKKKQGLRACANKAINHSKGSYIIRLDADDYFTHNALKDLSYYVKKNPNMDLVYGDFYYVDKNEKVIGLHLHKKINVKKSLFNLPAHGACSLVKKNTLVKLGGYNSLFDAQDGYELWLKFFDKKLIGYIQKPIFYYRQHENSMSTNENKILEARRKIKRYFVSKKKLLINRKILFVVGARNKNNILFKKINKKNLIEYTLNELSKTRIKNKKVIVSTDSKKIKEYVKKKYNFFSYIRPTKLSSDFVIIDNIIYDAFKYFLNKQKFTPDIVVFINSNAPCIKKEHILKAIDTLVLFNSDSVISVYEDLDLHFKYSQSGLKRVSKRMHHQLRMYRDSLLVDNKSITACWSKVIKKNNIYGKKIGHINMKRSESINIKNTYDFWLAEKYLKERNKFENF